jgi:hypothetical protein
MKNTRSNCISNKTHDSETGRHTIRFPFNDKLSNLWDLSKMKEHQFYRLEKKFSKFLKLKAEYLENMHGAVKLWHMIQIENYEIKKRFFSTISYNHEGIKFNKKTYNFKGTEKEVFCNELKQLIIIKNVNSSNQLRSLNPFLDEQDSIWGRRLRNFFLPYPKEDKIVLLRNSHVTEFNNSRMPFKLFAQQYAGYIACYKNILCVNVF